MTKTLIQELWKLRQTQTTDKGTSNHLVTWLDIKDINEKQLKQCVAMLEIYHKDAELFKAKAIVKQCFGVK